MLRPRSPRAPPVAELVCSYARCRQLLTRGASAAHYHLRTRAQSLVAAESCLARKLRNFSLFGRVAPQAVSSCIQLHSQQDTMGAFQSIPDDVLTGALTTCVLGHWPKADDNRCSSCAPPAKTVATLSAPVADKNIFRSLSLFFWSTQDYAGTIATEPREMRLSAWHVEAMGRVFGAGCTALYASGRSPERIAALEVFVSRTRRLKVSNWTMLQCQSKCCEDVSRGAKARKAALPTIHGDLG